VVIYLGTRTSFEMPSVTLQNEFSDKNDGSQIQPIVMLHITYCCEVFILVCRLLKRAETFNILQIFELIRGLEL